MATSLPAGPSLGRALSTVADTAVDQARTLAAAQLDRWAGQLHERLATTSANPAPTVPAVVSPLIIGALAGAVVAWLVVERRTEE